jgi:DNA-directed RNA polymerase specialized sigma24 family protein
MAEAALATIQSDGDLLVRALARGDEHALTRLAEAHSGAVYGLLRMALPNKLDVEQAFCATFAEAAKRAGEPLSRADASRWLTGIAVEQIAELTEPSPPIPLALAKAKKAAAAAAAAAEKPAKPAENESLKMDTLKALNDKHLGVLVRTLEARSRQALVLSVNCGLSEGQVASAIGCDVREVRKLKAEAMMGLRARLAEHERREDELRRKMATGTAYHLRPIHRMPQGIAIIKNGRVYIEKPPSNLLVAIVQMVKRILGLIFHHDELDAFSDDTGETMRGRTPSPTAGARPFLRPKLTPSLSVYRTPKGTRGMATYQAPKSTPGTQRVSAPRNPLRATAAPAWSSIRFGGRYGTRG